MVWTQTWAVVTQWFKEFAADEAYSWAAMFPAVLEQLAQRDAATGLYCHRWATTAVVSRFGVEPDWESGAKLQLTPLPGSRMEVKAFGPYNKRLYSAVIGLQSDLSRLVAWLMFVAGEASAPEK